MGTSSDRDGGRGGAWSPLKVAATSYAKSAGSGGGTDQQIRRLLGRHVAIFGGPAAAAGSSIAGATALGTLGGFLSSVAEGGFAEALRRVGLEHLIGGDRFDVLGELMSALSNDGADLESQAARDAECDVLDDFFGDADSWTELESLQVDERTLESLLSEFIVRYVYNRIPAIGERLARILDPERMRLANERILGMISDYVDLKLPASPLQLDWAGLAGRTFSERAVLDIYTVLDSLSDGDL